MRLRCLDIFDIRKWHPWFAWFPVHIGDECVWLETIERKGTFSSYDLDWEYRFVTTQKGPDDAEP